MVKAHLDGQADIYGFNNGHHFEIEVKMGKDKLKPPQESWRKLCDRCGVPYRLVHANADDDLSAAASAAADWVASL